MEAILTYLNKMYKENIEFHMFIQKDTYILEKRIKTFQDYIQYVLGYSITRNAIYILLVGIMPESDLEKMIILSILDKGNKYVHCVENVKQTLLYNRLKTTEITSEMFLF